MTIEGYFERGQAEMPICCFTCTQNNEGKCTTNKNEDVSPNGMCPSHNTKA